MIHLKLTSHFSAWTGGEEPGTGRGKAEGGPIQGIAFCSPQSIVEFSFKERLQQYEASFKLSLREILCASKSGSAMVGCRQEFARRKLIQQEVCQHGQHYHYCSSYFFKKSPGGAMAGSPKDCLKRRRLVNTDRAATVVQVMFCML